MMPFKITYAFGKLDTKHKNERWYRSKYEDTNEEHLRIVKTLAMVIKQDVHSHVYDTAYSTVCI